MNPGGLIFDYFGASFFIAYHNTIEDLESMKDTKFKAGCRSIMIKLELFDLVGCIDSELL